YSRSMRTSPPHTCGAPRHDALPISRDRVRSVQDDHGDSVARGLLHHVHERGEIRVIPGADVLDVGARYYTYLTTLVYVMEEAAQIGRAHVWTPVTRGSRIPSSP